MFPSYKKLCALNSNIASNFPDVTTRRNDGFCACAVEI